MLEVSVILPIFNAITLVEDNIRALHDFLIAHFGSFEIVAVDDGSADGTSDRLSAIMYRELRILRTDKNYGKGHAVALGMTVASGACRVFTDVDLPYDLMAILVSARLINQRGFHVVIGDRSLPGSNYYAQASRMRTVASRIFATIIRLGVTGEMYDTQCGFKAFRGDIAQELFPMLCLKGFGFDVELLYVALKYNMEIKRIPVRFNGRSKSTVNPLIDGMAMLFSIVPLFGNWRRGKYKNDKLAKLCELRYWE